MEDRRNSLAHVYSPLDPTSDLSDSEYPDPPDTRPSILITFQNSASYYTSYMGSGGTRSTGTRPKATDIVDPQQQLKTHPVVLMKDYPAPPPVCVTVNDRKLNGYHSFQPYSGPPTPPVPQGPPGPPGPPVPNLPSSRRGSFNTNTLEVPKERRGSATPSISSRSRSPTDRLSTQPRTPTPPSLPQRPRTRFDHYDSATMPRGFKTQTPKSSYSMPSLAEATNFPTLEVPILSPRPSPRPSISSVMTESNRDRRTLIRSHKSIDEIEDCTSPQPEQKKPNWISLNMMDDGRKRRRSQTMYVAEIWPSLVCILTAVVMTLVIYILVSYFYSSPHPVTRNRIAPSQSGSNGYPHDSSIYQYPYPYIPLPYDRYPHYQPQYPQKPLPADT
ncbi:hypothetical protein OTU49_002856 [Cherax quadricarinatus]|uniref:Uncharacterized protein n=1 Tax=Cherax quadricarinatus TaxID=27406 RepID=A0AAW0XKU7_CHEQU